MRHSPPQRQPGIVYGQEQGAAFVLNNAQFNAGNKPQFGQPVARAVTGVNIYQLYALPRLNVGQKNIAVTAAFVMAVSASVSVSS